MTSVPADAGAASRAHEEQNALRLRYLGIDTYREPVIFMRRDCHICRAVGFTVQSRVQIADGVHTLVATLNMVAGALLAEGEAGLSEVAWQKLHAKPGDTIVVSHPPPVESLPHLRAKVYGNRWPGTQRRCHQMPSSLLRHWTWMLRWAG